MADYKQNAEFAAEMSVSDPLDVAVDWIAINMDPDDVFPDSELESWAESNGYIKEEEDNG